MTGRTHMAACSEEALSVETTDTHGSVFRGGSKYGDQGLRE